MYTNRRPIWLGVLIAPLAAPVVQMILQMIDAYLARGFKQLYYPQMELALPYFFGIPIGYTAMLILGVPYIWMLRRAKWLNWVSVIAGAAVAGGIAWTLFFSNFGLGKRSLLELVAHGSLLGLTCGLMFCAVVRLEKTELPEIANA